jgi:hypothetical protein
MGLLKSFGIACLMFLACFAYVAVQSMICMWLQHHVGMWAALTFVGVLIVCSFTFMVHTFRKGRR